MHLSDVNAVCQHLNVALIKHIMMVNHYLVKILYIELMPTPINLYLFSKKNYTWILILNGLCR